MFVMAKVDPESRCRRAQSSIVQLCVWYDFQVYISAVEVERAVM